MIVTKKLSIAIATVALMSASCLITSPHPASAQHKPVFGGLKARSVLRDILNALREGGVAIVLDPSSGEINAYGLKGANVFDSTGKENPDGSVTWNPPLPPRHGGNLGEGEVTDIEIYPGSGCIKMKLNGQWVAVCT
jgi:hypothetical protein